MKTIGAVEVKLHFDELLREVESGETIVVTRQGHPVAHITPVETPAERAAAAMEEINRLRRELRPTLGAMTIRELIEEGRRY